MTPDIARVAAILREAAAAEVMPRFQRLAAHEVSEKKPGDIVTAADLGVEAMLTARLPALVTGSRVVGEEAVHGDPSLIGHIAEAGAVWIVDPIDGTTNFSEGKPLFAVQLAFVRDGVTRAAWLLDPVRDIMATAEDGAGAWMEGQRLAAARPAPLAQMTGALYAGPTRPGVHPDFKRRAEVYGDARYRRCVGQEYLSLVTGAIHFALFTRLLPWDHAAGVHIAEEAGAYARLVDGRVYRPTIAEGYILLAPDEASWRELRAWFLAP
ncbi:MAG: inositol monophosphatase [Alphaproteobacteria bacterium]